MDSNNQKGRIFISYGHDEYSEFALSLVDFLKENGYDVFIDKEGIQMGREWEIKLEEGLLWTKGDGENGIFILLMTPYSVRRPDGYCLNEMLYALDLGLKMIPVMLKTVTPPLSIYRLQYLDLTDTSNDKNTCFPRILHSLTTPDKNDVDNPYRITSMMRNLDPLDFTGEIELFSKDFVGRKWSIPMIEDWASEHHGVLVITGSAGVGKTALAVFLYNHLPDAIAFYMFRRNDNAKLPLKRFVTTIAYEMSTQIKEYREALKALDLFQLVASLNPSRLFQQLIVSPLMKLNRPQEAKFIIIDGLDEAELEGYNQAALFLEENLHYLPDWINVIITTRPHMASLRPLDADMVFELDAMGDHNLSDIKRYVESTMPYLDRVQREMIIKKSQGSFLYVKRIGDWYRHNREKELPTDIQSFYHIDFCASFPSESAYTNSRFFLELILASAIPLSKAFLEVAAKETTHSVDEFLTTFDPMIRKGKDSKIRIEHSSLVEWLESEQSGAYRIDISIGQRRLLEIIKSILLNDVEDGDKKDTWVEKFHRHMTEIEFSMQISYDDFATLFIKSAESLADWRYYVHFSRWYLASPHTSYKVVELISDISNRHYEVLKDLQVIKSIDEALLFYPRLLIEALQNDASKGITSNFNSYGSALYYFFVQDIGFARYSKERLTDFLRTVKETIPSHLSMFSSGIFHNECDFADEIVELFTDLCSSHYISDPKLLFWLSKVKRRD